MKIKEWLLVLLIAGLSACGASDSTHLIDPASINPDEAAIPDGIAYPDTELSEEDKRKLANAKGVAVKSVGKDSLEAWLADRQGAQVCYFWSLNDKHSKAVIGNLRKLSSSIGSDKVNVVLINMDGGDREQEVNATLRETGIGADMFRLQNAEAFQGIMGKDWTGRTAIFIYNGDDGTGVFYKQELSFEELYVLLQPFTI